MNRIVFVAPIDLSRPGELSKPSELTEGEKPYTLTRLEYLEIKLNTVVGTTASLDGISGQFSAISSENKMIIVCAYCSDTASDLIDNYISSMEVLLINYLKYFGWEDWVKIEVKKVEV